MDLNYEALNVRVHHLRRAYARCQPDKQALGDLRNPIRIVEVIVTGISFLGAGTIFRRDRTEQVDGLTTAASILLCAAIGISVALREFGLAVGVPLLALFVLARLDEYRETSY